MTKINLDLQEYSHKRFNFLTGEWVLVSPHRAKRPWEGQKELISNQLRPTYDLNCYLCSGNTRINGKKNPEYKDVFVFKNDFGALQTKSPNISVNEGLFKAESELGICKVICFSSDHSMSLAEMEVNDIYKVIETWQKEYTSIGSNEMINYVQIFENKGAAMGCSNSHPHGQIWSQSSLPNEVLKKDQRQSDYKSQNKSSLIEDYLKQELKAKERIIYENNHFVILTPFWAIWPFETMIAPKKKYPNISEISIEESLGFADAISKITKAYDKLFECSFPYSSGIHQAPTNGNSNEHWHFHMSFYPPLLRSATIKKFMVGYEMFGSPQRDITPEQAAFRLKKIIN